MKNKEDKNKTFKFQMGDLFWHHKMTKSKIESGRGIGAVRRTDNTVVKFLMELPDVLKLERRQSTRVEVSCQPCRLDEVLSLMLNWTSSFEWLSDARVLISDIPFTHIYRTLHSYKLFWAVCHLFPQRWQTLNIQSRETIGQEDYVTCLKLRRRVNSSPAFLSHLQDAYFL